jgi:small-conductance mechanosensitive channel
MEEESRAVSEYDFPRLTELLWVKIERWYEAIVKMLPNLALAILVLIFFIYLSKWTRNLFRNLVDRVSSNATINNLFGTIIQVVVFSIGIFVSLSLLQLDTVVTSLLAGAGIIGLALGFAFQDLTANFISGVLLAVQRPIKVGDIVKSSDHHGFVEKIELRSTVIRTFQGLHVIIPNKDVFQNSLINYTKTPDVRIDLEVGISYGDDLEKVKQVVLKAVETVPHLIDSKPTKIHYTGFGDSSINFVVQIWITYRNNQSYLEARSDAIIAIKKAFDNNDITIPFPIRTLDFGIKGGQTLSEMAVNISNSQSKNPKSVS